MPTTPAAVPNPVAHALAALSTLRAALSLVCADPHPDSHWVVEVGGLNDPSAVSALGRYATALIAQVVRIDLVFSAELLETSPAFVTTLTANVHQAIGHDNQISNEFRRYQRDPWITEVIGHLLFMIAAEQDSHCVPGRVAVLTLPHIQVRQQGLDLIGVYALRHGAGISITESKASETYCTSQLTKAVRLFRALDRGDRSSDVLQALNVFTNYLPDSLRTEAPIAIWAGERLYAPLLAFRTSFHPTTERPTTLGALKVPHDRRRLLAVRLHNYAAFFDDVADAMRGAIKDYY
ncbi:MAG: hypothetical protein ACLP01_25195 [Solirubrobacteraceae bacterium]